MRIVVLIESAVLIAAVLYIAYLLSRRGSQEVRRKDVREARKKRDEVVRDNEAYLDMLIAVEDAARKWSDIDSVLAAEIRAIMQRPSPLLPHRFKKESS